MSTCENSQAVKCPIADEIDSDMEKLMKCQLQRFHAFMLLFGLVAVSFMLFMQYKIYSDLKSTSELKIKEAVKRACEQNVAKSSN